jgi:hypothetical protein
VLFLIHSGRLFFSRDEFSVFGFKYNSNKEMEKIMPVKKRLNFVSNSSSSSFVLFGVGMNDDEFFSLCQSKLGEDAVNNIINDPDSGNSYSELSKLEKETGLEFIHDWECEYHLIGRQYKTIGDNETGLDFKNSVKNKLKAHNITNKDARIIEIEMNH